MSDTHGTVVLGFGPQPLNWFHNAMFQSTPVIADGRSWRWSAPCCCPRSFNPRPSLLTGEAQLDRARVHAQAVSIHARHC